MQIAQVVQSFKYGNNDLNLLINIQEKRIQKPKKTSNKKTLKQVPIPVLFVSFEQNLIHLPQGWEIGIYRRKKGSKQESNHALDHKKRRRKEAGQEIRKHALVHEKRT